MEKFTENSRMPVMSRDEVRYFDKWAINQIQIPGVVLMENAGSGCARFIADYMRQHGAGKVCILAGTGNNGGDGFVIARHLHNAGFDVRIVVCGDLEKISGDAKINLDIARNLGLSVSTVDAADANIADKLKDIVGDAGLVVDALLGTGLHGSLREPYPNLIKAVNGLARDIISVDIPSGLDCDSGESLGQTINAVATVTFAAIKKGFTVNRDVKQFTGDIYLVSIGVEPFAQNECSGEN